MNVNLNTGMNNLGSNISSQQKPLILIVDDNPTNIKVLSDLLIDYEFEVLIAKSGEKALQQIQRVIPDLILLDVLMPGLDGFETCRRLKADSLTKGIPIIFMTALTDPIDKVKGLSIGAVDYVTKPLQHEEVLARVNVHLKLRSLAKQLSEQNALLQEEVRSRQLAELALRLSEEKFVKVFRSNPGAMMLLNLETHRFLEVNQAFCNTLGYSLEDVYNKTMEDLSLWVDPLDCDRFYQKLQTAGTLEQQEFQFYAKGGTVRLMLVSAEVIQVGNTACVLAMTVDITTLKPMTTDLLMGAREGQPTASPEPKKCLSCQELETMD